MISTMALPTVRTSNLVMKWEAPVSFDSRGSVLPDFPRFGRRNGVPAMFLFAKMPLIRHAGVTFGL
jgi:hypothetical protein